MILRRKEFSEFPYVGTFLRTEYSTTTDLLSRADNYNPILSIKCDIQLATSKETPIFSAKYKVFYPLTDVLVSTGDKFIATMEGKDIEGIVVGCTTSQLGNVVYIKDTDNNGD